MSQKIIYGTITGSIEGYDQCVVLVFPDDVDAEEMEKILDSDARLELPYEDLTTWQHVLSVLPMILAKADVPQKKATGILAAVIVAAAGEIK